MRALMIAGALVVGFMMYKDSQLPRGIRNNNPLNIRIGNNWKGEVNGNDAEFETFATPIMGIRAAARLLKNYRDLYGLDTIEKIIFRWSPPNENDTDSYINSVSRRINIDVRQVLNDGDYVALIAAMIFHENGMQPYDVDTIKQGFTMGFSG